MPPVHRFGPKPGPVVPVAGRLQAPASPGKGHPYPSAREVAPAPGALPPVRVRPREGAWPPRPATADEAAAITPPPSPPGGRPIPVPHFSPRGV